MSIISNRLLKSRFSLSKEQLKFIFITFSKVSPNDPVDKTYSISYKEYASFFDKIKRKDTFTKMIETFPESPIWLDQTEKATWFSWMKLDKTDDTIYYRFDPLVREQIVDLKNNFTDIQTNIVCSMNKKFTIRLYSILRSFKNLGKCSLSRKFLDHIFMTPKTTKNKVQFIKRDLIPAIDEINTISDIYVKVNMAIKQNGDIVFNFTIKDNESYKNLREEDIVKIVELTPDNIDEIESLEELIEKAPEVTEEELEEILDNPIIPEEEISINIKSKIPEHTTSVEIEEEDIEFADGTKVSKIKTKDAPATKDKFLEGYLKKATNMSLINRYGFSIEQLEDLLKYRREIKHPVKTHKGLNGLLRKIFDSAYKNGISIDNVITIMQENEWRSVEPDWVQRKISSSKVTNPSDNKGVSSAKKIAMEEGIYDELFGEPINPLDDDIIDVEEIDDSNLLK